MFDFAQWLQNEIKTVAVIILIINVLLHLIFANAVARDGMLLKRKQKSPYLVSGLTWAFATLVGGVFVAGLYWFMHYSKMSKLFD